MTLFYAIRLIDPVTKVKRQSLSSSHSCFGGFATCFHGVLPDEVIDRRMFFSTSATEEQFNLYAKAMREGLEEGFEFRYAEGIQGVAKGTVTKRARPTIGFYARGSTKKGFNAEFSDRLAADQNYVSFSLPEGTTAYEGYTMIKVMLKFLTVPHPAVQHFETFEDAYKQTNCFLSSLLICGWMNKMGGYGWPMRTTSLFGKQDLFEMLSRKGPLVFEDYGPKGSQWEGTTRPEFLMVDFAKAVPNKDRKAGNAPQQYGRVIDTAPPGWPLVNKTQAARGSREATAVDHLHGVKAFAEFLKGAKQGKF